MVFVMFLYLMIRIGIVYGLKLRSLLLIMNSSKWEVVFFFLVVIFLTYGFSFFFSVETLVWIFFFLWIGLFIFVNMLLMLFVIDIFFLISLE